MFSEPGDVCEKDPLLEAFTIDSTQPKVITLCVKNFDSSERNTLKDIEPIRAHSVSVSKLRVHSLTLLHELFHLIFGQADTPDLSCRSSKNVAGHDGQYTNKAWLLDKLNSIVRFKTPQAVQNPESFTLYAFSYYLGLKTITFKDRYDR